MEIKILWCVLQARVYHRRVWRNQSALKYLHLIFNNMRFNPSPCVQSPAYIFCQICQNLFFFFLSVTTEFYLRTCKLYMISFFSALYFRCKLVERVAWSFPTCAIMASPAVCQSTWHVSKYERGAERLQILNPKFFCQHWFFETSALSKLSFGLHIQVLIVFITQLRNKPTWFWTQSQHSAVRY